MPPYISMMLEKAVLVEVLDNGNIELIGSVHSLYEPARQVIVEVDRFLPSYVCVELYEPLQPTRSLEIVLARERYLDRLICIDRPIDVTVSRYMSSTSPIVFLKESLVKYFFLPFNIISIAAFNLSPHAYHKLTGGRFFTFGWSRQDSKAYIFERDEYMAGTLAELIRSGTVSGKCAVLVGRRHVPGMKRILEAFQYTNDIGSYYAGGRVYDVFSLAELREPYTLSYEKSSWNFLNNRLIETLLRTVFLPAYVFILFIVIALIAMAIVLALMKVLS